MFQQSIEAIIGSGETSAGGEPSRTSRVVRDGDPEKEAQGDSASCSMR